MREPTIAEYPFPRCLVALRGRTSTTTVALESGNSAEVGAAVLEGRAENGFIESPRAEGAAQPAGGDLRRLAVRGSTG
ncbi:hypothetical protein ACFPFX_21065 [Streptomyces mauvecolor]|uniref:Uncharacterized protein n=1 Tax=Streptomyces mauvecolor TaxID=58345 RepID=A0ABV9UNQ9_9ACTN